MGRQAKAIFALCMLKRTHGFGVSKVEKESNIHDPGWSFGDLRRLNSRKSL